MPTRQVELREVELAYRVLYERLVKRVRAYVRGGTAEEDAEDCIQELFTSLVARYSAAKYAPKSAPGITLYGDYTLEEFISRCLTFKLKSPELWVNHELWPYDLLSDTSQEVTDPRPDQVRRTAEVRAAVANLSPPQRRIAERVLAGEAAVPKCRQSTAETVQYSRMKKNLLKTL